MWIMLIIAVVCIALAVSGGNKPKDPPSGPKKTRCRCPNCGAALPPGARQCGWCGDCW